MNVLDASLTDGIIETELVPVTARMDLLPPNVIEPLHLHSGLPEKDSSLHEAIERRISLLLIPGDLTVHQLRIVLAQPLTGFDLLIYTGSIRMLERGNLAMLQALEQGQQRCCDALGPVNPKRRLVGNQVAVHLVPTGCAPATDGMSPLERSELPTSG